MEQKLIEIILFMLFIATFIVGFILIYKQVALVKKGEFTLGNLLNCVIYGLIFGISVMVVMSMAIVSAIALNPSISITIHPITLLFPLTCCLIFVSIYPLLDFLYIALSKERDEGLTPFQKILGNSFINRFDNKIISVILAMIFYFGVFIIPPILLGVTGIPFLMIWITFNITYPLLILTFYGSKGYIAGISNCYYHIPEIKRIAFLGFENKKRSFYLFFNDPGSYILMVLMLVVYVWAWISLIQTIGFFFTGKMGFSTMSSVFVFITLAFGLVGYFTRYWSRQIKFRPIQIYFAAWLMTAIAVNVFINFLMVNIDKLAPSLNSWIFTEEIVPSFQTYAWPAAIEEFVLIVFISYFFIKRSANFNINIQYSKITECGQKFDPIPLFNFIKSNNPKINEHAENTLKLIFERIPLKNQEKLKNERFMNNLFDGICDYNQKSINTCMTILRQLENDAPDIVLPWILQAIQSPNYDKSIPVAQTLIGLNSTILEKIPLNVIKNLINDPEWRLKQIGIKFLSQISKKNKEQARELDIKKYIDNPDNIIQAEVLNILASNSITVSSEILFTKLKHPNKLIKTAAIRNLKNISAEDINIDLISKITTLIKDPSSSVRAAIFNFFTQVKKLKELYIPILPFLDGLTDSDENVRKSSILVLEKYFVDDPKSLNLDDIAKRIDTNNNEILDSVLTLLGKLWDKDSERILSILLHFIKDDNKQLRSTISKILVDKYIKDSKLILKNLISIPDESKFITKGIIANTIIEIAKKEPKKVIAKLLKYSHSDNEVIVFNAVSSLDGLVDDFSDQIKLKPILSLIKKDSSDKVKKEANKLIQKVAKKNPLALEPIIDGIFHFMKDQELSIKIALSKSILEIAKKTPKAIPLSHIIDFIEDNDPFIRESGTKILGFIGIENPNDVMILLIEKSLSDEEWNVREAAVSSLGNLIENVEDKGFLIEKLVSLLDDKEGWVKRSAMKILSNVKEINSSHLPFSKLSNIFSSEDPNVREALADLLMLYHDQINDIFEKIALLLGDPSENVRISIISALTRIINKVGLDRILSKLLQNLSDEVSIETQRSVATILGRTAKYKDIKTKKRIIALLKIRCEMSQDPVLCKILNEFQESMVE